TVARWASSGLLGSIRTPGGHRRFREADVVELLNRRTH
ncbi:MerR family DNA-binding transcriptional regulator, partial [Streptomyces sp. SID10244]|nr:MerR family DNA-binding transcriptional regulator [Streptomyces sp. SID10244]